MVALKRLCAAVCAAAVLAVTTQVCEVSLDLSAHAGAGTVTAPARTIPA